MGEDIKQLICNYWDLHGTFAGIEKTVLLEELQRLGKSCDDIPIYKDKSFRELAENSEKCNQYGFTRELTEEELQSVLLLANYVVSSPGSVIIYSDHKIHTALISRNLEKIKGRRKSIVRAAVDRIEIIQSDDVAMFSSVLYTPCDADIVRENAVELINSVIQECSAGLSENKAFIIKLLNRDNYYFRVVALAKAFGLTVNDICGIYNYNMPDMMLGLNNFGQVFVMLDDSALVYTDTSSVCLSAAELATARIQRAQQAQALQQLGAF